MELTLASSTSGFLLVFRRSVVRRGRPKIWWGEFFERQLGVVKLLLLRHGRELLKLSCDCEAVVNAHPLKYISNDPNGLVTRTPAMIT